jgi:hypothetical protein
VKVEPNHVSGTNPTGECDNESSRTNNEDGMNSFIYKQVYESARQDGFNPKESHHFAYSAYRFAARVAEVQAL